MQEKLKKQQAAAEGSSNKNQVETTRHEQKKHAKYELEENPKHFCMLAFKLMTEFLTCRVQKETDNEIERARDSQE